MSDKWRANKAWEDANLVGPWLALKWTLRVLSSITLAVIVLVLVALYGVSASVPVGLLALAPTYLIYGATLVLAVLVVAGVPALLAWRVLAKGSRAARVVVTFFTLLVAAGAGAMAWYLLAWPAMRYDPVAGTGLRLFAPFVKDYSAITLRRLPGMEMSELEYYSWWPLRLLLMIFVVNMVVATVRRIAFTFKNIGVLTVHTGIVVMALGSVYYSGLKREGDTLLLAGEVDAGTGRPKPGPPQRHFYDNTAVALYLDRGNGWETVPLRGVPRYNDYGLGVTDAGETAWAAGYLREPWKITPDRALSVSVSPPEADLGIRIVGYASYATPATDWVRVDPASIRGTSPDVMPLRIVHLHSHLPGPDGQVSDKPIFAFMTAPGDPLTRATGNDVFSLEYTLGPPGGMSDQRWADLSAPLPEGTKQALVIEVPGAAGGQGFRGVFPVREGEEFAAGGYRLKVVQLAPKPPFPIITEGYRGASSSVAVVRITAATGEVFDRYVYHRFPEIAQDLSATERNERGMPVRKPANPAIRVSLIEAGQVRVYIDEPEPGRTRAIVRSPGGGVKVYSEAQAASGVLSDVVPGVASLRIAQRWDLARRVERPAPVPLAEQDRQAIGTHENAMLGLELSGPARDGRPAWSRVVWVPFSRYVAMQDEGARTLLLPDGRRVRLAFGRLMHQLPFDVSLVDFRMIAYDHRGAPRDYQSVVRVEPESERYPPFEHVTKLNEPLRAPWHWDDSRVWIANIAGRLGSGLSPLQFKLSQAGWDASGWQRTQAQADAGLIPGPYASFTILGVGNNPGIHVIAAGGVLMGLGIPWAFYVKPYLVRREKRRLQEAVRAGRQTTPPDAEFAAVHAVSNGHAPSGVTKP